MVNDSKNRGLVTAYAFPILTMLSFLLCGCDESQDTSKSHTKEASLTMGTSADNPPFESYRTGEGETQIIGFDIDVAKAIGEALGVEVKIKEMDFSTLIPALQAGRVDFVMAGMTITPERKKNVDFTHSYIAVDVVALASKDKTIQSSKDLKGMKVGVQLASSHEQLARQLGENDKTIKVVPLNKLGELVQELIAGRIDAVLMETVVGEAYAKSAPNLKVNTLPDQNVKFAIAFAKGSPWTERFNKVIDQFTSTDQFKALKKKWFSQD